MQTTLKNLSQVSLWFFMIFGGLHISSSLLIAEGVIDNSDLLLFNILDLPFLAMGLIYGSSKLSLILENITGNLKTPLIICSILSVVIFLMALFLNFGFTDAQFI